MAKQKLTLLHFLLHAAIFYAPAFSATFTLTNNCTYTVWPGLLSGAGTAPLPTTGFALPPSESRSLPMPSSWSGKLWGRTLCTQDPQTSIFTCATGDCNTGTLECPGGNAAIPATLAEFTLSGSAAAQDFYDVSLVDGYNLPILISPVGGSGPNCTNTGCASDLNKPCPTDLRVNSESDGRVAVACKSACGAFDKPEFCCQGAFGSPDTCKPSTYSEMFKSACPRAYSYAYDDKTSTFVCGSSPDYVITFCPSSSSAAASVRPKNWDNGTSPAVGGGYDWNGKMVYDGLDMMSSGGRRHVYGRYSAAGLMALWMLSWMGRV
uniref:Thaumatin-like protein n=1 Tax=Kalanchoe fedtschenkoi TaxID=63787 RepID=A0A7N0RBS8_KALFE